jgi:hypothetical protein
MALLEKRALFLLTKKSHMAGAEKTWKITSLLFSLLHMTPIQADKTRFGHNSWFLEGTRLMRKITYTVLTSHTWGIEKRSASFLSLSLFFCSLALNQSLPSSSHSPFFVFFVTQTQPFLLLFPRSSWVLLPVGRKEWDLYALTLLCTCSE